jgi:glutathione S-transferase
VQWALEEIGLEYRFHALEQTAGSRERGSRTAEPVPPDPGHRDLQSGWIRRKNVLAETKKLAARWFRDLERRLEGREWIALDEFTVADIALASVVRTIRRTDLTEPFPRIRAYFERCHARPAWQRTLTLAGERLRMTVDELR